MSELDRKAALVTGTASGIGEAIARRLADDGWDVLAVDLNAPEQTDAPGAFFQADLTTREGNQGAVDAAMERFGRLDAVIPNAGFQHVSPVADLPEDRWEAIVALLLTSPFLLAKYAWPALVESGAGRFVAIASVHGLVASPYKAAYVAAKHGIVGLTKVVALETAQTGVTCNAICPGWVLTSLVDRQIRDRAATQGTTYDAAKLELLAEKQPSREFTTTAEIAGLAMFMCSDSAAQMRGQAVALDGGWTAQ